MTIPTLPALSAPTTPTPAVCRAAYQRLPLDYKLPDLLAQLADLSLALILPDPRAPLEQIDQPLARLALSLAHPVRMHSALRSDLADGPVPVQRLLHHPRVVGQRPLAASLPLPNPAGQGSVR